MVRDARVQTDERVVGIRYETTDREEPVAWRLSGAMERGQSRTTPKPDLSHGESLRRNMALDKKLGKVQLTHCQH